MVLFAGEYNYVPARVAPLELDSRGVVWTCDREPKDYGWWGMNAWELELEWEGRGGGSYGFTGKKKKKRHEMEMWLVQLV